MNNLNDLKILQYVIEITPYWRKIQILFNNIEVKKHKLKWLNCYIKHLSNQNLPCEKVIKEYNKLREGYFHSGEVSFFETPCSLFSDFCISNLSYQYTGVQDAYFLCPFFKKSKLLQKFTKNFIEYTVDTN